MPGVANLNIKIDRDLKAQADKLFSEMGMNLTTAVNVFVRQAVLEKAIPFRIYRGTLPKPEATASAKRQVAMQEIRELLSGIDGNDVDLEQMRMQKRSERFERNA